MGRFWKKGFSRKELLWLHGLQGQYKLLVQMQCGGLHQNKEKLPWSWQWWWWRWWNWNLGPGTASWLLKCSELCKALRAIQMGLYRFTVSLVPRKLQENLQRMLDLFCPNSTNSKKKIIMKKKKKKETDSMQKLYIKHLISNRHEMS